MKKFYKRIENAKLNIPVPIFGIGCGVLGLSLSKVSVDIGKYASTLLRALEYRGYDSTGAAFQNKDKITLLKDVGAPSTLVKTLGIENQAGSLFCGQVRWATFGQVDKKNAQPHWVKCKREIYGAHNGNITNTRDLRDFLLAEGHNVVSDNDGEMLVHAIEHYFDIELDKHKESDQKNHEIRTACMRAAIVQAGKKVVGSYAAVICDPITEVSWAIKAGSSLYFGMGEIDGNKFGLTSSDLTAILRFTKFLVNLREGEFVEYTSAGYQVFSQKPLCFKKVGIEDECYPAGSKIEKSLVRSKLRAEDTELLPDYEYFMEQEIYSQPESTGKLIKIYQGGSNTGRRMIEFLKREEIFPDIEKLANNIEKEEEFEKKKKHFDKFLSDKKSDEYYEKVKTGYQSIYDVLVTVDFENKYLFSEEKNQLIELMNHGFSKKKLLLAKALDSYYEDIENNLYLKNVDEFIKIVENTKNNRGVTYSIACGTSYNATKVAALFFNEIAGVEIIPILPGDFRGEYSHSLKDNDLIIGVSQSGETKDLIDIFNDIDESGLNIRKVVIVNNMNSTLGQEKSDVAIPIYCGPEIAVPATKSFMNELTVFYYLAIRVAERMLELKRDKMDKADIWEMEHKIAYRKKTLQDIPLLLKETIIATKEAIADVANKTYMEPSMHILATKITGVAYEGALKIRETVLNHTEGKEASEFKHGPNTILGKNTTFGLKNVKKLLKKINHLHDLVSANAGKYKLIPDDTMALNKAITNYIFDRTFPFNLSTNATELFKKLVSEIDFFDELYRNYPLVYITGPDDRDVNLTISQINTHKIRGADTFVIAEENDRLMENVRLNPFGDSHRYYGWGYIPLPKTGDTLMTCFSASIALQLLALRMSIKKMEYLDRLGMVEHGVHPDVPKNVSKSITVD
ncbi:MAG: SIS domain-containing protein [Candidatus Cloacimonadales bacterium]